MRPHLGKMRLIWAIYMISGQKCSRIGGKNFTKVKIPPWQQDPTSKEQPAAVPTQVAAVGQAAAAVPPAATQDAGESSGAGAPGSPV